MIITRGKKAMKGNAGMKAHGRVPAFTLVELLIAVVLLVVIISSLILGFRSGLNTYGRGQEIAADLQNLRSFLDAFQEDVRNCVYFAPGALSGSNPVGSGFKGKNDSLFFLTKRKQFIRSTGAQSAVMRYVIKAVAYKVASDPADTSGKTKVLLKSEYGYDEFMDNNYSIKEPENIPDNVLLGGLSDFKIEYSSYVKQGGSDSESMQSSEEWPPLNSNPADPGTYIDLPARVIIEFKLIRGVRGKNNTVRRTVVLPLKIGQLKLYQQS